MQLLLTVLLAALATQQPGWAQCSCSSPGGAWSTSPLYRVFTAPPPSENDIVPRAPPRCSCGCSPSRLPPRLPPPPPPTTPTDRQPHAVSALSGLVMDSPVFQQMGPATVIETPPPVYVSSPDDQTCPSHIMTIPRKQDNSGAFSIFETSSNVISNDVPPTITYSTAPNSKPAMIFSTISDESPTMFSSTPQQPPCPPPPSNSVVPVAPVPYPPPPSPPRPVYFAQPAPLIASCPATLFYPAAPAATYAQPSVVYPVNQASPPASQIFAPAVYSSSNNPTVTYSSVPLQNQQSNFPQAISNPSQSFSPGICQNSPSNTVTFTSDFQQNTFPQPVSSPSQSFSSGTFQNTASNAVTLSNDIQLSSSSDSLSAPQVTSSPASSNSPLTYTLLTSAISDPAADVNRDCSVPVPPALL